MENIYVLEVWNTFTIMFSENTLGYFNILSFSFLTRYLGSKTFDISYDVICDIWNLIECRLQNYPIDENCWMFFELRMNRRPWLRNYFITEWWPHFKWHELLLNYIHHVARSEYLTKWNLYTLAESDAEGDDIKYQKISFCAVWSIPFSSGRFFVFLLKSAEQFYLRLF